MCVPCLSLVLLCVGLVLSQKSFLFLVGAGGVFLDRELFNGSPCGEGVQGSGLTGTQFFAGLFLWLFRGEKTTCFIFFLKENPRKRHYKKKKVYKKLIKKRSHYVRKVCVFFFLLHPWRQGGVPIASVFSPSHLLILQL